MEISEKIFDPPIAFFFLYLLKNLLILFIRIFNSFFTMNSFGLWFNWMPLSTFFVKMLQVVFWPAKKDLSRKRPILDQPFLTSYSLDAQFDQINKCMDLLLAQGTFCTCCSEATLSRRTSVSWVPPPSLPCIRPDSSALRHPGLFPFESWKEESLRGIYFAKICRFTEKRIHFWFRRTT